VSAVGSLCICETIFRETFVVFVSIFVLFVFRLRKTTSRSLMFGFIEFVDLGLFGISSIARSASHTLLFKYNQQNANLLSRSPKRWPLCGEAIVLFQLLRFLNPFPNHIYANQPFCFHFWIKKHPALLEVPGLLLADQHKVCFTAPPGSGGISLTFFRDGASWAVALDPADTGEVPFLKKNKEHLGEQRGQRRSTGPSPRPFLRFAGL